jgi:hypothetical protein
MDRLVEGAELVGTLEESLGSLKQRIKPFVGGFCCGNVLVCEVVALREPNGFSPIN